MNRNIRDFDTPMGQHIARTTPHTSVVTVTEKRAPTDESIRLLAEMEQAARNRLLDTIHVKSTVIDAKVAVFEDMAQNEVVCYVIASFNGNRQEWTFRCSRMDFDHKEDFASKVRAQLAIQLTDYLMLKIATETLFSVRSQSGKPFIS